MSQKNEEKLPLDIDKQEGPKSFKTIWKSKTFYVNLIAMIAFVIQHKYGYVIDEATQVQILSGLNILLRTVSSEGVSWS
jgi:hypothetical protein